MIYNLNLKIQTLLSSLKIIRLSRGVFAIVFFAAILTGCAISPLRGSTISVNHEKGKNLNCNETELISIDCGKTPMVAFDSQNRLWAVFESEGTIYLSMSEDNGGHFSQPVAVNSKAEVIYTNGENRPKIQIGKADEIYISWNKKTEGSYTGDIRFSRSLDQGKTFSAVTTINDDGLLTGHRFDSLQVANDGTIFISWIDKREAFLDKSKQKQSSTAAIYTAFSIDQGATFSANKKLADSSCVCCRIAMTATQDGSQVAVFWRHVFAGNVRDHAFATLNRDGVTLPMQRATDDDWVIEACPHHGPAITQDQGGAYQMVWFTAGEKRKGIYYGQYNSQNKTLNNLFAVSKKASASHPAIINNSKLLLIVWKEFDGEKTQIYQIKSRDKGITWEKASAISSTIGNSDHPLLTLSGDNNFKTINSKANNSERGEIWLSWFSQNEGLRLFLLN